MVAETIKHNEINSSNTQYYMDCKKDKDEFVKKIMELDKGSKEFEVWLSLSDLLSSMIHLLGGMFSDIRELKNKVETQPKKAKDLSTVQVILLQGFVTLIMGAAFWFFTEIAPRIFSIPHP